MAFLDKKEDVLDIELTQYGKYLLSQGRFKPTLYAFFDDDVLYDGDYGGLTETQSNIEYRIKNQTPSQGVQYVYAGVETSVTEANKIIRSQMKKHGGEPAYLYSDKDEAEHGEEKILPLPENSYATFAPLGTCDLASDKSPAWLVRAMDGNLTGSVELVTGSHSSDIIPQLSASMEYEILHKSKMSDNDRFLREQRVALEDGTVIIVNKDPFVLQVEELNTTCTNENFDIEVFLVESSGSTEKQYPLYWPGQLSTDEKGNVDYDFISTSHGLPETELEPNHANYFFKITLDDKVDTDTLCKIKRVDDVTCLFPSITSFECALEEQASSMAIAMSKAAPGEKLSSQMTVKDTYKQVIEEVEECD